MTPAQLKSELQAIHLDSFGWAMQCCNRQEEMAKDVLQSAYLKVLEGKAIYRKKAAFKTWFFAIIRNTALDQLKKRDRSAEYNLLLQEGQETSINPISLTDADDQNMRIQKALASLPRRQKELVHLLFYQGLTLDEAAVVMNISKGSVRQHYHRAKIALAQWFNQQKLVKS